jgi:ATP-binding cassette subfamily B protein
MFVTIFISYLFGIMYGIILIAIMVAYIYFSFTAMSKAIQAQEIHNKLRAQASARMVDSLLNFETVKYFNNEKYEREHAANLLYQQEEAGIERFAQYTQVQMNQVLIIGIGFTFLTWLSGTSVYAGTMSVGDFVLINGYILGFIGPLHHFSYIMQIVRKGIEDMESIIKILHLEPEIEDMPQAHNIHISKAQITFEHIFFGYAPDRIILKNISFDVPAGKTIALVGPSGAGKSTIARLLFRFYDINAGNIKINGIDIRAISQQSLRKAIGIVPQDTVLFNDTIYYNIAYGNPHASQEEVKKAAELAHLGNFIQSLPQGYKTIVGERGLKLSGGEKQRVAIARVLLKKPSIYIFDEATSSLDSNTEKEIQKNLQEISVGTTTIIIAHRLSTIIYADEIYVLDCGQIIEHETHMQLLKEQGLYANLWQKQQHEYNAPN